MGFSTRIQVYSPKTLGEIRNEWILVKIDMKDEDPLITYFSQSFGRVYLNTSRERHEGYLLATDLVPSVRFTDSYTKNKTKNPDIITLQISQKKQMALQIYGKRKVLGSTCYTTHLNSIIVCPSSFKIDRDMELDKEILGEIGSQSHLFLQLNSQNSMSQILQNVCKNRRAMNLMVHKNFQEMGGLALEYSEGVLTMTRGEVGILFLCQLIPARPLEAL